MSRYPRKNKQKLMQGKPARVLWVTSLVKSLTDRIARQAHV